ncbi:MAG TPA: NUDIX domain-containing protein [Caulobacteraceae bacterium]|jgi:8-oxo-dGTP pyrophosphatase MutT (NUDIX family)
MTEPAQLKVTSFVVRGAGAAAEVLLIRHPFAGIQFPAGTIEPDEDPATAALREASEETGLADFGAPRDVGVLTERLAPPTLAIAETTPFYFRPHAGSVCWGTIRRGFIVREERREAGFVQITYEETDRSPDPQYITFRITGWVAEAATARLRRRYFYVVPFAGETPDSWPHTADNHTWTLFWAPVSALPAIIPPQDQWVPYLQAAMG